MSDPRDGATLTILLNERVGSEERVAQLLPLVYEQLRAAAQVHLQSERPDHTLQATALVHEAYLKLVGPRELPWQNRSHFYAAAAQAMRRILIDHARGRGRVKRGGGARAPIGPDFSNLVELTIQDPDQILAFEAALCRLEADAPETAAVVRLRFFAGLSIDQTAAALGISDRTVDREWLYARAWLRRELDEGETSP